MNELDEIFNEVISRFSNTAELVRIVLSGRRRNMQTPAERIDIRPVLIKDELCVQISSTDGRQMTSKNFAPNEVKLREYLEAGYANILIEDAQGSLSIRIAKKGTPLISRSTEKKEQKLDHDRSKKRLLDPSDPFLIHVGISDASGAIKPSKADKYKQVEEFLRLLGPLVDGAISAGQLHQPSKENPLTLVDLGCGHAYLTFGAHQYLNARGLPTKVIGIDIRESSRVRNEEIAKKLDINSSIEFRAEEIADTEIKKADIAIALHACDTATDDAIAWAINNKVPVALFAPCCHHDIQAQMKSAPGPWSLVTKNGIMKERLGDLITDTIRIQILKLRGYRTDAVEFIGGEHTPRNLMIRAVFTDADSAEIERTKYRELISEWGIKPALESRINSTTL
jgi:SAM-dependent methyltransferase